MMLGSFNEVEARRFIECAVPQLRDDEVLVLVAFLRRKYGGVQRLLCREILRDTEPDYVVSKIRRMLAVLNTVDSSAGVLYIDLTPKSTIRALNLFCTEMFGWLSQSASAGAGGFDRRLFKRLDAKLFSAIHRSTSRKPYLLIDIDSQGDEVGVVQELIYKHFDKDIVWVSRTRGGYHYIINRTGETIRTLSQLLYVADREKIDAAILDKVEVRSEVMTPVPGTLQGGVMVEGLGRAYVEEDGNAEAH